MTAGAAAAVAAAGLRPARAADTPGVTATEIKIGHTNPYSGPASAYSSLGKLEQAYFNKMVNEQGGVAGHKINFISLDDGYSPPKTVEDIRQLVEEDKVAFTFNTLGTPTNSAIERYMNQHKVPMLFVATGADKWGNYKQYPVDHRLAAQLPHGSADLHEIHDEGEAELQAGHPLSERRFRQGLSRRRQGRARRQVCQDGGRGDL